MILQWRFSHCISGSLKTLSLKTLLSKITTLWAIFRITGIPIILLHLWLEQKWITDALLGKFWQKQQVFIAWNVFKIVFQQFGSKVVCFKGYFQLNVSPHVYCVEIPCGASTRFLEWPPPTTSTIKILIHTFSASKKIYVQQHYRITVILFLSGLTI